MENRAIKRVIEDVVNDNENLHTQVTRSERKIDILLSLLEIINKKHQSVINSGIKVQIEKECGLWEEKYNSVSKQLDDTLEKLDETKKQIAMFNTRNVNKKIKRRDEQIEKQKNKIKEQQSEIENLVCEKEKCSSLVEQMKREKKNLLSKINRSNKKETSQCYDIEINQLKEEIKQKELKIIELEEINEAMNDPNIQTYYNGKYTNEIRETIMTLITECGVSQSKVNQVLEIVVKNLTGKNLARLPSTGVKSRLVSECKRVAQKQVVSAMLQNVEAASVSGNCLHQDGTTKSHRHYQSFQLTTSDQRTYSLGLCEVSTGDADSLMKAFKQQLSELAATLQDGDSADKVSELVCSITSTMSDQGSVNPVFNRQLTELKQSFLPDVVTSWDTLDANIKNEVSKISSYFCKMHIFVNMASEVDKCLSVFESNICSGKNPYAFHWKESSATRLTRTASKALTMHGCDKSGVGSHFTTYLQSVGQPNMLITFRGHRFNHLFYAAGATYFHSKDINSFLQSWADPNELLKSVAFDIREKSCLSGIRALGIVDKLITGPFWRIIEKTDSILDLNPVLKHLQARLEELSKNASSLLNGISVFQDTDVNKDAIYISLFEETGDAIFDTYTQMALELICSSMLLILERQAKDQLPGGQYSNPSESELQRAFNVPTTNTCSERDFAQLDMLMRLKPSASTTAYEACIMWTNNKTSSWLKSLPEKEKNDILNDARTSAPSMIKLFQEKQRNLFEQKLELLHKRQELKVQKEAKVYSQKVGLTKKINLIGGLWSSETEVMSYRNKLSNSGYKDALVTQLQFRKSVIQSKGPKEKFQQVSKGKVFNIDTLEQNLLDIIKLNSIEETDDSSDLPKALSYLEISDAKMNIDDIKFSLVKKIREGRNKIVSSQQATLLPSIIENPETLVGRKFKHKCRDPDSNEVAWEGGWVDSLLLNKGRKSQFHVVYEDDGDNTLWKMPLIIDMEKGAILSLHHDHFLQTVED